MTKTEFQFLSNDKKTQCHGVLWLPDQPPAAILQIVHGSSEYIERYEPIADYFVRRGIAVIGHDILGHGGSIAPDGIRMFFGEADGWNTVAADAYYVSNYAKQHISSRIPHYILGFSLGSFLVRTILIQSPGFYDGAILVGTGMLSLSELFFAKRIALHEGKKHGFDQTTALIHKLTFDNYNKRFQPCSTENAWLLSNDEAAKALENDPKRGGDFTCGFFRDLLDGMKFTCNKANIKKMDVHTSILLISGREDPVGKFGKGIKKLEKLLHKAGYSDVKLRLFPGRHDILREKCGNEVLHEIARWMQSKGA